jgi:ribosomal protein L12E/L44/L45/RPP1/RPP2
VIPTIPDGIHGTELIELISGMNSADITQVIQSVRQHINMPLDSTSLDMIVANLDETDAQDVLKLLQQ